MADADFVRFRLIWLLICLFAGVVVMEDLAICTCVALLNSYLSFQGVFVTVVV